MNLIDLSLGWQEDGESKPTPFSWDEILPWEWHHIFKVFPPEVLEMIVRALCFKADKWIDGYRSIYRSVYRVRHPDILPEDRIQARERIISLMMYGIDWVAFDVYCAGCLKHTPRENARITDFLRGFSPIKCKDAQKNRSNAVQNDIEVEGDWA